MIDPEHHGRELAHVRSLCELGRYAEAIDRLGPLLASQPDDIDALTLLAAALLGAGENELALTRAHRALGLDPEEERLHRIASGAARGLGRRDDAVHHAEAAIALAPGDPAGFMTLAQALICGPRPLLHGRENRRRARAAAVQCVSLAPGWADAHLVLGNVLAESRDRTGATAAYERALAIRPDHTVALNNRAALGTRGGRRLSPVTIANPGPRAEAVGGFARALTTDPGNQLARRNLDQATRGFLIALAWLIVIDAQLARWLRVTDKPELRLLPLFPLLLAVVSAARYIGRLTPTLRTHLRRIVLRERPLTIAIVLLGLGTAGLVAGCLVSPASGATLAMITGAPAVIGYLTLLLHTDRHARSTERTEPMLRSGVLWLIVIGLAIMGMAGIHVLDTGNAPTFGLAFTLVCFGGAAAVLAALLRRGVRRG